MQYLNISTQNISPDICVNDIILDWEAQTESNEFNRSRSHTVKNMPIGYCEISCNMYGTDYPHITCIKLLGLV